MKTTTNVCGSVMLSFSLGFLHLVQANSHLTLLLSAWQGSHWLLGNHIDCHVLRETSGTQAETKVKTRQLQLQLSF